LADVLAIPAPKPQRLPSYQILIGFVAHKLPLLQPPLLTRLTQMNKLSVHLLHKKVPNKRDIPLAAPLLGPPLPEGGLERFLNHPL